MSEVFEVNSTGADKCFFRPQLFYQPLQSWHIADSGLEFNVNMSTGIHKARFPNTSNLDAEGNEDRLISATKAATTVVPKESSRGDGGLIRKKLESAVTWENSVELGYLLRSCYVTEQDALAALAEASSRGTCSCVSTLLSAGVSGCAPIPNSTTNKNALHMACENGQEEVARMIISSIDKIESVYQVCLCPDELTCFDLLRRSDLNGMARRLEEFTQAYFENK